MKEYLTVIKEASGEYEEKRSKFISRIFPCHSENEAMEILAGVKADNFGANHNVYAYVLSDNTARFSDDGEPHGTAGKPILEVINGEKLFDILIVVTRYFGGVLLGTGGLVRAYTTAAKDAVNNAQKVLMSEALFLEIICDYTYLSKLQSLIIQCGGVISDTVFGEKVTVSFIIPKKYETGFYKDLKEQFSSKLTAKLQNTALYPF